MYLKWLPFGLRQDDGWLPDRTGNNDSYYCAASNPYFWGWSKFYTLIDQVLAQVPSGLQVSEIDLENEIDLAGFTVQGRLIYDNTTSTDVYGWVRAWVANRGIDDMRVTYSTQMARPWHEESTYCNSYYGERAMILGQSELMAAIDGRKIGVPPMALPVQNGLWCAGGGSDEGMRTLPLVPGRDYTEPGTIDVHAYVCFVYDNTYDCRRGSSPPDVTGLATALYNGVYEFIQVSGRISDYVVFGEANPTVAFREGDCPAISPMYTPPQNVQGFVNSLLNGRANTVMRPWNNMGEATCFIPPYIPNIARPPY